MLHTLIFLHCDACHQMYEKLSTATFSDSMDWPQEIEKMGRRAKKAGWHISPNWSNHLCPKCNEEFSKVVF